MRIVTETRLKKACEKYPDAQASIQTWIKLVKLQEWNSFADVKTTVPFAPDQVKNFVIFDIGGNKYRLITCINYKKKAIYIRDFLTHAEYSKDNWKNDEWFDS
ncbi:type II toxin-antitoxin system HigB family toxin [Sphaerospermopsis sp. FACHB-1094]|uniref:type II toxin-antitoxin system HigB family toxin n=1 Tax=Sphaerospermopsis sp. FACHB-1094 TaxID=2692861 RepID=UPI0016858161|nr:type II toxin-antitoxin system HigB family toxin [Sphaerospermopsis sp. FACHB-1094]MBD2131040.1 type II toxin-antitoxin system HigB family toxin [Sphaerospermopsis sp. FACHB-1094]